MKTFKITNDDIKNFMLKLLVNNNFDNFEVRQVDINSFAKFSVASNLTRDEADTLYWNKLKPYVYNIIKGSVLPKNIKIVFNLPKEEIEKISANLSACFLNFVYDDNNAYFITGVSTKTFSLNKQEEILFDEYVIKFLKENEIRINDTEPDFDNNDFDESEEDDEEEDFEE